MYGLYLALVAVFCLMVIVSVVRSVRAMTPEKRPEVSPPLTVRECLDQAQTLYGELEIARKKMGEGAARTAAQRWSNFRIGWLERLRVLESQCAPSSRSRPGLAPVFAELQKLVDLYTTHAVQYSGEVGPAVDRLKVRIETARQDEGGRTGPSGAP